VTPIPLIILTVPRMKNYLNRTLQSLFLSGFRESGMIGEVIVVTGAPDHSHLSSLDPDISQDVTISVMPQEIADNAGLRTLSAKQKCAFGHYWWMRQILASPGRPEYVVACEDDVIFAKGWAEHLRSILPNIRPAGREPPIVTLYRPYIKDHTCDRSEERFRNGERWYEFSDHFWGTQAVVYPLEHLDPISRHLYDFSIKTFTSPVDDAIGAYAWSHGIPTIATTPCLVNHIGEDTTGQSHCFHVADYFLESVQNLPQP